MQPVEVTLESLSKDQLLSLISQLQAGVTAQHKELLTRAAPRVAELIDALDNLSAAVEQGNVNAKQSLKLFVEALDRARSAASGITLVK